MWHSILSGRDREDARRTIDSILDLLAHHPDRTSAHVGAWPAVQRAFVLHELAGGVAARREISEAWLEHGLATASTTRLPPRLHGGFLGLSWLLDRIDDAPEGATWAPEDTDEDDAELDDAVARIVEREPVPHMAYYDLVEGLVGAGVYTLHRPERPRTTETLERIVYRLEETAEYLDDGIAWWGYSQLSAGSGILGYNLGLAHGVPGIVAFLARALRRGITPRRTLGLLEGAVEWLLARRLPDGPSRFATVCTDAGPDGPARAAWCYGDPGVALALLCAARAAERPRWEEAALDTASLAARRSIASCGVLDASVCHGAAGLMHVYNRIHQATGQPLFAEAARKWFRETQRRLEAGHTFGDPTSREPREVMDSSILEGPAGIALALDSAISDRAPKWDAMLLMDLPPHGMARAEELVA